jgi:hypothetical protein
MQYFLIMGRDIAVGIATRYGLEGLEIEFRWEREFPSIQSPVQWVMALIPAGKVAGSWRWLSNPI